MELNYYIDESGEDNWLKEKFYTVSACAVQKSDISQLEESINKFKQKFSEKLDVNIAYLHGSEITYGLNQSKGLYAKLGTDKKLAALFFSDLTDLLASSKYRVVSLTLDIQDFMQVFNSKLADHYRKRGESFQVTKMEHKMVYFLSLLQLTEMIRIHINCQMDVVSKAAFYIEGKDLDIKVIIERCKNRFSDVDIEFHTGISKKSAYPPILEFTDLAVNAINQHFISGKARKDYDAIKSSISIQKMINSKNIEEYMPFNL